MWENLSLLIYDRYLIPFVNYMVAVIWIFTKFVLFWTVCGDQIQLV